jgi:hypothetical protein
LVAGLIGAIDIPGLQPFLEEQPGMSVRPATEAGVLVAGEYYLDATHQSAGRKSQTFYLELKIPPSFPSSPPVIHEVGGLIPREADFHVNESDGSFCLGTPLNLKMVLHLCPDLAEFLRASLRPFLYAVMVKLEVGGSFVFGELPHGNAGVATDFATQLNIENSLVPYAIKLLTMKKRVANKRPCPCRCGMRLGSCRTNILISRLRQVASRAWFKAQLDQLVQSAGTTAE